MLWWERAENRPFTVFGLSPKGSYCNFVDMILNLKINSFCRRQFLVVFCLKMENLAKMMASRVHVVKPLK